MKIIHDRIHITLTPTCTLLILFGIKGIINNSAIGTTEHALIQQEIFHKIYSISVGSHGLFQVEAWIDP
jgi:hypothetical protein